MSVKKFVGWRRVSTFKQSKSGLGLEAQKEIIRYFVEREGGELLADYEECYTGKDLVNCTELRKAIEHCKQIGAVLVIAKTDRFRNTVEALQVYEEMGDGNIMFCDLPHTDKFTLTLFFALAEREALLVSIRTKQALAVKKAQGYKLGAANENYKISKENLRRRSLSSGATRSRRVLEEGDTQALIRIMKKVFPKCASHDEHQWRSSFVNTRSGTREQVLSLMRDYKELDQTGVMFKEWDFSDLSSRNLQHRLASKMQTVIKLLTT